MEKKANRGFVSSNSPRAVAKEDGETANGRIDVSRRMDAEAGADMVKPS